MTGQAEHHVAHRVAQVLDDGVLRGGDGREPACRLEHLVTDIAPLRAITVEQALPAGAAHDQGQLPGQIHGVLHAGVHPLPAGRAVDVRRVAGQEHAPVAVSGDLADRQCGIPAFRRRNPTFAERDRAMTTLTRVSDSGSAAGAATGIAIEELGAFSLTAVRTGAGNLKLISWYTGGDQAGQWLD